MNYRKIAASVSALAVLATSTLTFGATVATAATTFTDASSISTWAADAVAKLADAGVVSGRANGSFDPAGTLNRAEVAKIAVLGAKLTTDTTGAPHFNDVKPTDWFYPFVETLYNKGVVGGINGGKLDNNGLATYNPAGTLNRAEASKILVDAFGLKKAYAGTPANFDDVAKDAWFFDYVETAYAHGLIKGYGNRKFGPADAITREQVAVIAQNTREEAGLVDGIAAGSKQVTGYKEGLASTVATTTPTTDTPTTTTPASDGTLAVALSANTPAAATIPNSANVVVAAWDLTASSAGDVTLTTLTVKHGGIGARANITALVLQDGTGNRVSKSRSSVSSDDTVTFSMLNSGLTITAGTTKTVKLVISTSTASDEHNFGIASAEAVGSNAKSVTGSFPVTGNTMKLSSTAAGKLTVYANGTPAAVKVGQTDAILAKLKLTNTNNVEDIKLSSITLKNDGSSTTASAFANAKLIADGTELAKGVINDKYVTFNLATPLLIAKGITKQFQVNADIIGEAGGSKTIKLVLDSTIDILATGVLYGFGTGIVQDVSSPFSGVSVNIDAGAIAITKVEPADKIQKNKKKVVLGTVKIAVNSGKDLQLKAFNVNIATTITGGNTYSIAGSTNQLLENLEVYSPTTGTVNTLSVSATTDDATASKSITAYDRDFGVNLANGKTYEFQIRGDTTNDDDVNLISSLVVSIPSIDGSGTLANGIQFQEQENNTYVSDVTPSALTFKTIRGQSASVTLSVLPLSAAYTAVVGTSGVSAFEFQLEETAGISDVDLTEFSVKDTVGANFTSGNVSSVDLYTVDGSTETLVKSKSGSQISSSIVTFDGINVKIAKSSKKTFRVKVSLVQDTNNNGHTIKLRAYAYTMTDSDANNVHVAQDDLVGTNATDSNGVIEDAENTASSVASARTITLAGTGSLYVSVKNDDSETNKVKYALAGATSPFIAAYELRSDNEDVKIKDFRIVASGNTATLDKLVSTVSIYKADKTTLIASKAVTGNTVQFTGVDYIVPQTSTRIYVKLDLNKYGKDQVGVLDETAVTLAFSALDTNGAVAAEGNSSGNVLTNTGDDADSTIDSGEVAYDTAIAGTPADNAATSRTATSTSLSFGVLATQISAVSLESSGGGFSLPSKLSSGSNVIGIIKVTTPTVTNSESDGTTIKTYLTGLKVKISKLAGVGTYDQVNGDATGTALASITLERAGGVDSPIATAALGAGGLDPTSQANSVGYATFTGSSFASTDDEITPGSTVYYVVKANVTLGTVYSGSTTTSDYVQLDLDNLNSTTATAATAAAANFEWKDSTAAAAKNALRLAVDKVDGIKLSR